jgi:NAD(P)H-dependent flavin oxidoreductase YrpB (nitropropane dioxygenase family)
MTHSLATVLTERLGCAAPIIQTAMGWVAEPSLVIGSSNAGAFGFLGCAVMTPDEARAKIKSTREGTDKPFGVNFHSFQPGAEQIVELILANRDQVRAVSFGRGPNAGMIGRFKDAGILCIPTVGAVKHARKMAELGVDMVTVQGGEGGGHTGSVPTTILLPQVLDTVKVPVIAAGGFGDGRGLAAALAYGAVGIAMGTRFLLTQESPVPEAAKAAYIRAGTDDIVVTTKLDGIPQRMVRTRLMDRIEKSGALAMWLRAFESSRAMKRQSGATWLDLLRSARGMTAHGAMPLKQAIMAATMPMLIQKAVVEGDPDHGLMATGLVAGRLGDLPSCADLLGDIERDARARLAALSSSSSTGA